MPPDGLPSPCLSCPPASPMSARKLRAKEIPTAPTADRNPSWLSAPHTQIGGGSGNYRGTWTQKPGKTLAQECKRLLTLTSSTHVHTKLELFLRSRIWWTAVSKKLHHAFSLWGGDFPHRRVSVFGIYLLICCTLIILQLQVMLQKVSVCWVHSFEDQDAVKSHFPDVSALLYLHFTKVTHVMMSWYLIPSYYLPVNCVLLEKNPLENKNYARLL